MALKTAIAVVYHCKAAPGLQVLQLAHVEPPFGHPWTKENTVAHDLILRPSKTAALQTIFEAIAEYNGDYEHKLGVSREEHIYNRLFPLEV